MQWLFGKDIWKGWPTVLERRDWGHLPFDKVFRLWVKSDPGTTAVYDKQSVDYIVNSDEGMKYYAFFKMSLLGSEEHYFISLLYNYNRTRKFVEQSESIPVWNTWRYGMSNSHSKGPNHINPNVTYPADDHSGVHTKFLSINELNFLRGMRTIGIFFARKVTSSADKLLDAIDSEFLHYNAVEPK